jgi:tRNA pseudouridine38-40 synthase
MDQAVEPQRVALKIQYLGTGFFGWQWQPKQRTVQLIMEEALTKIARHPVRCYGAGRTDTGVHASGQVIHFKTTKLLPAEIWVRALNGVLPDDVVVRAAAYVDDYWHARFTAIWREYRYTIHNSKTPELFVRGHSWFYPYCILDVEAMHRALSSLEGRDHDLRAFRRTGSLRAHSLVHVHFARCTAQEDKIFIQVRANSFLYGMMRLLVGSLAEVGSGRWSPEAFAELWKSGNRNAVKYAAPPQGLSLIAVGYPEDPFLSVEKGWHTSAGNHEERNI